MHRAVLISYDVVGSGEGVKRTDTAGEAFGAFLTLCVIFGGLGRLVTLSFFAAQRLAKRPRRRERTPVP